MSEPVKYALPEFERRFLVSEVPPGAGRAVEVHDSYIIGTRLRLRRMTWSSGQRLKLGHKVRPSESDPSHVLHTSLYLNDEEFARLLRLPHRDLVKRRHHITVDSVTVGVDVFHGELEGLTMAEVSFTNRTAMEGFAPAVWMLAEVTSDERFTGGALAAAGRDEVPALLADYGVASPRI